MADNMRLALELTGKSSNLTGALNSAKSSVSRFSSGVRSEFSALRGMAGSLTGQLAALGVSFSALKIAAGSAQLDKGLTKTARFARASAGEMANLRRELFGMARQTGRPLEELQGGFDDLLKKGLDWKSALEAIKAGNLGASARTAEITTLNSAFEAGAAAFKIDFSKAGQAALLLDKMAVAADKGKAPLEDLAAIYGQFGRAMATAGLSSDKALGFIEGLSQAEANPERLAALTDRTTRIFSSRRYMKYAQQATKVRFFDKKGERRDATDIMADLKKKYDSLKKDSQRTAFLQKAFGRADADSEAALRKLFEGDGIPKMLEVSQALGQAGGTIDKELKEAGSTLTGTVAKIKAEMSEAADGFAKPINDTLNNLLKWSRDSKENGGLGLDGKDMMAWGAGAVGATALLGRYGGKMAGRLFSGPGSLAEGVVKGEALKQAAGVTPVFVVNMPDGFGAIPTPGATGGPTIAGPGGAAGGTSRIGKAVGAAGKVAGVAGAALGGYEAGGLINQGLGWASDKLTDGKYGGEGWLGNMLYDLFHPEEKTEVKNDIKVEIAVDQDGRVVASSNDPNTTLSATKKRGKFIQADYD